MTTRPQDPGTGARARRRWRIALLVAALLAVDLSLPAPHQVSGRLLVGGIRIYQASLSPRMPALGIRCRFTPSCSHYAAAAIARHGALGGSLRAAWRLARCGPWTPAGTIDPP